MLIAIDDQCMVHEHSCILNLKYPTKIGGAHFGGKTKRLTPSRYRVWFGYVDNISRDSGRKRQFIGRNQAKKRDSNYWLNIMCGYKMYWFAGIHVRMRLACKTDTP